MRWSPESQAYLQSIYLFVDFRREAEQCEQCFLDELGMTHVREWMRGRWEYYASNVNCAFSVLIALVVVAAFSIKPVFLWYAGVALLILMFTFNGYQAWRECMDMDEFMVRNFDRIRSRRSLQNTDPKTVPSDSEPHDNLDL